MTMDNINIIKGNLFNTKAQTIVNTDSLIDAQRQVEARDNVQSVTHVRPATPMD